jgi:hypothetical protein
MRSPAGGIHTSRIHAPFEGAATPVAAQPAALHCPSHEGARSRFKEAIKECNQGLSVEGSNAKVLNCRARARFESGLFKDALADIVKVNASSEKSEDSTAFEAKVRTAISGKANGTGGNGTISDASAAGKPQQYSKEQTAALLKQSPSQFVCKVTLESETKYVHVPYGISYYALQQIIKSKWTGLHNFRISYQDKDQDWVLITSAKDVNKAQQEILAYAQRLVNQRQRQGLDSQVQPNLPLATGGHSSNGSH